MATAIAQVSARKIKYSRLLDIVSGSAFATAKGKDSVKRSIYKDFDIAKLNDTRFREILTANLPAFYLVDTNLIAKEIANSIVSDPNRFVNAIYTAEGLVAPGEPGFQESLVSSTSDLEKLTDDIRKAAFAALNAKIGKASFDALYSDLEKIYLKTIGALDSISGGTYAKYRNAAIKMGFEVRNTTTTYGTFIATDAARVLKSMGPGKLLIISPTFDAAVRKVNDTLLGPIEELFENRYNISVTKNTTGFKIGNIVNAGHTGAVSESGQYIGVNMPSAQEAQFRLDNVARSFEIERELVTLYSDIGFVVEFNQDYTNKAAALLDLQFAFVVSMPAELNTKFLRVDEQKRIKKALKDVLLPELAEQARNKLKGGIIDPSEISASPSIKEFAIRSIIDALEGKTTAPIKKSNKAQSKTKLPVPTLKSTGKVNKLKVKVKSGYVSVRAKITNSVPSIVPNLLQLINANLFEQIKKNMGDGNRRDVLNYRTGRLARSASVERISESRNGMITAFYTYMKNPYATFSAGGMQQYPRTRDPKLLISKSIREIAASQVQNRLRAVLV